MTKSARTAAAGVIINLCFFILLVSAKPFREFHHHWIFPVLALIISAQWALAGWGERAEWPRTVLDLKAARSVLLSMLGFLLLLGMARHQTILACFGGCSFKLGLAAAVAAAVYAAQARLRDDSFWNRDRAFTAALACALWALYLVLCWLGSGPWKPDLAVLAAGAALLPWRRRPAVAITLSAIVPVLLIRRFCGEYAIIVLDIFIVCAGLAAAGRPWKKP